MTTQEVKKSHKKAPVAATIGRSVRMIAAVYQRAAEAPEGEEQSGLHAIAEALEKFTAALFSKSQTEIADLVDQFITDEKAAGII